MSYVIPDPRWEAPSLLAPNLKPVFPVAIDWSHPLAPDKCCYLLGDTLTAVNLVDGHVGARVVEGTASLTTGIDGNVGQYTTFNSANGGDDVAGYQVKPIGPLPTGFIVARIYPTSQTGDFRHIFSHGYFTGNNRIYFYHISTQLGLRIGSASASGTGLGTAVENNWYDVVATWTGTTQDIYINGTLADTDTFSGTPGSVDDYTNIGFYRSSGDESTSNGFDGRMAHVFVGSKYLGQREIDEYRRNPYQFLIPA